MNICLTQLNGRQGQMDCCCERSGFDTESWCVGGIDGTQVPDQRLFDGEDRVGVQIRTLGDEDVGGQWAMVCGVGDEVDVGGPVGMSTGRVEQDAHRAIGGNGVVARFHRAEPEPTVGIGGEQAAPVSGGLDVGLLHVVILRRWITLGAAGTTIAVAAILFMFVGTDYFPQIDAGQMTLHVRAPPGMRIEQAEKLFQQVEDTVRQVVPPKEIGTIIDNIGLPLSGINLSYNDSGLAGPADGDIIVSLRSGHGPTAGSS